MMNEEQKRIRRHVAEVLDKADDKWQHGIGSGGYDMSDPLGYFLMLADALRPVLADVWDDSGVATAEWMWNNPGPSGIPSDPPQNPYL